MDATPEQIRDGTTTHPMDMCNQCEGVFGSSPEDVRNQAALILQAGVDFVDSESLRYDAEQQVDDYCPTCDYTRFFCDPARFCCPPGIPWDESYCP